MSNNQTHWIEQVINKIKQHWLFFIVVTLIATLGALSGAAASVKELYQTYLGFSKQEIDKDFLRDINIGTDINYAMGVLGAPYKKKKNDSFLIQEWRFNDFDICIVSQNDLIVELKIILNSDNYRTKFNIYTEGGFVHPCGSPDIPPLGIIKWKDIISCSRRYNISFGNQQSPLYIKAALNDYAIRCEQTSEYLLISYGGINIHDVVNDSFLNSTVNCLIIRSCREGEFCDNWCHGHTDTPRTDSRTFDNFEDAQIFIKKELEDVF